MTYLYVLISLLVLELVYFRLASRFNIIDKPNERSSHTKITLRGGGIIFYFGTLIYFFNSGFQYYWFFIGLTIMTLVSFLDDIYTLSNRIRLLVHFCGVLLMAYQLQLFVMPWFYLFITFIVVVGVINAYNFMDGINGITGLYSLSITFLLFLVNRQENFIDPNFLIFTSLGLIVFLFFNFRKQARCFAGDVGSVAIAYILIFGIALLIIKTQKIIYILFLIVYGVDTFWTIISRLYKKENIFEAHRSHLYQYLGNEANLNKLAISFFYAFIQLIIGYYCIIFSNKDVRSQYVFSIVLIIVISVIYLISRALVVRKFKIK
ncbi:MULTISPECIES: MraY family glycosyltransferase [unclassified Sphingobacterium]|uniref:MraY family glycosyltransferase n=1 Tax=unclassified Sphingobacterium TaxID=2609468 RepID=UPI0025E306F4|nr:MULTISPECIES: glycosyltransferase family 4 protein [unclassified Sphingobacterium]